MPLRKSPVRTPALLAALYANARKSHGPQNGARKGIQEDLLLRILRIIEATGSGLAVPFQVGYAARDKAVGAKKS